MPPISNLADDDGMVSAVAGRNPTKVELHPTRLKTYRAIFTTDGKNRFQRLPGNWGNVKKGGIAGEKVAERTGLEPATPGVTGRYSNQLNYRSTIHCPLRKTWGWHPAEPPWWLLCDNVGAL